MWFFPKSLQIKGTTCCEPNLNDSGSLQLVPVIASKGLNTNKTAILEKYRSSLRNPLKKKKKSYVHMLGW